MSEFQLDKKTLIKDLPVFVKPIAGSVIDWLNNMDLNHDGKKDLVQVMPYLMKAVPFIAALAPLIDWEKFLEWLLAHSFIKDAEAARKAAGELLALATQAMGEINK